MSDPDKEISKVGGSASGADDHHHHQESGGGGGVHVRSDGKKIQIRTSYVNEYGCGGTRNFTKARKVVLFPFTKAKKHLHHRRKANKRQPSSSSSGVDAAAAVDVAAANESISGNIEGNSSGVDKDGCFCFKQPQTLDSSVEYHSSDPNDPDFTFDMLKGLIEKNDFYSKQCNPHLDFHDISCCDDNTTG